MTDQKGLRGRGRREGARREREEREREGGGEGGRENICRLPTLLFAGRPAVTARATGIA
jgi:hypothetical protein